MWKADLVNPGDLMVAGQVLGEPTALLNQIFAEPARLAGARLFTGMGLTSVMERAPAQLRLLSFVGMGANARLLAAGRMELVPCHMSELPWLMTEGPLRPDVVLVLVSPPDENGMCSLGVESDYLWSALGQARVVLAEINEQVPRVAGDTGIPFDRIDGYLRTDRPLPEYGRTRPSPAEQVIGAAVAEFVRDGSCLQVGVGRLGEAVLAAVADRRDLGVHSGMIGETVLELMRDGVITNAGKRVDRGLTVTGSILGGQAAVGLAAKEPALRLRSVTYTHAESVIAGLDNFVCVNSAIEVDLLGQVNTEMAGDRYVGGIGGSVDFLRSSVRAPGGCSVVALPATARDGTSRIVPTVRRVTAARTDLDAVVTEYGTARLRGVSQGERARRLVEVAAPEQRDRLRAEADALGL
jgi:acetyl-CoA hydrolase